MDGSNKKAQSGSRSGAAGSRIKVNPDERGANPVLREFPDDNACLDHLLHLRFGKRIRCPKCDRTGKFHKIRKIPAYACQWCGFHLHPMAGTRLARSRVGLRTWFQAIAMMSSGDRQPSAKQLQRALSVSYKTAWRMRRTMVDARATLKPPVNANSVVGFDDLLAALVAPHDSA